MSALPPPTPLFCDHCCEPVDITVVTWNPDLYGEYRHLDGYFGCYPAATLARVAGSQTAIEWVYS